jgi:hypothetical protein
MRRKGEKGNIKEDDESIYIRKGEREGERK